MEDRDIQLRNGIERWKKKEGLKGKDESIGNRSCI